MQNHVLDYLDNIIDKCPDKVAFANDKEELTFRDVYNQTRSVGTYLHQQVQIPLVKFPLTIGKLAPFCDVVIPDNTVSRMHARLEERNGQVFISDLNSTNGTVRNGDMLSIHEEVAMEPGDQIMFGRVCLTYC